DVARGRGRPPARVRRRNRGRGPGPRAVCGPQPPPSLARRRPLLDGARPRAARDRGGRMAPVVPEKLQWWRETPEGAAWLDRLPRLIAECAEQWALELEPPFERGNVAYCAPAGEAVLKINFPEWETDQEADALAHWDGHGAARLLARDDERGAVLMERLRPGGSLWELPEEEAIEIAAGLLE